MKPSPFDYIAAESTAHAVEALGRYGEDGRILAGGQSLIAMLNMRLAAPAVLIDISRTGELDYVREKDGLVEIGAAATQHRLEHWEGLSRALPLVALAMPHIAHPQIRNKGTVCGSLAHADPSSELPLCAALLEGQIRLEGPRGRRTVKARDFFHGVLQTARADDEVITALALPAAKPGDRFAFREMSIRHGDFAIICVAVRARADSISIAIGGAGDRPVVRDWPRLGGGDLDDALNALAWESGAQDDLHGSAAYRRSLIRKLGHDAIGEAVQ